MRDDAELIRGMMDISQPEINFWWPLAPAWYVIMLVIIISIWWIIRYWLDKTQFRRAMFRELQILKHQYHTQHNSRKMVSGINQLLKKICIKKFPDRAVAGMTGMTWLNFLDNSGKTVQFSQGAGQLLLVEPYLKPEECQSEINNNDQKARQINELIKLSDEWIRRNCQ